MGSTSCKIVIIPILLWNLLIVFVLSSILNLLKQNLQNVKRFWMPTSSSVSRLDFLWKKHVFLSLKTTVESTTRLILKRWGKLAMNEDEAERWIVDLIRNANLDAKI